MCKITGVPIGPYIGPYIGYIIWDISGTGGYFGYRRVFRVLEGIFWIFGLLDFWIFGLLVLSTWYHGPWAHGPMGPWVPKKAAHGCPWGPKAAGTRDPGRDRSFWAPWASMGCLFWDPWTHGPMGPWYQVLSTKSPKVQKKQMLVVYPPPTPTIGDLYRALYRALIGPYKGYLVLGT